MTCKKKEVLGSPAALFKTQVIQSVVRDNFHLSIVIKLQKTDDSSVTSHIIDFKIISFLTACVTAGLEIPKTVLRNFGLQNSLFSAGFVH